MAAERMMVEGVPTNIQYDASAKVCQITTQMVARLGLRQHGESCWMELTSATSKLDLCPWRPLLSKR